MGNCARSCETWGEPRGAPEPFLAWATSTSGYGDVPAVAPGEYTIEYWHEPLDGKGAGSTKTARVVVADKPVRADARLKL